MRALLLAAGLGTRLRPITDVIPKCLVPIHGKPLLGYWFDLLAPSCIDKIFINTHYLEDQVFEFLESVVSNKEIILLREPQLMGTGGTILKNAIYLKVSHCLSPMQITLVFLIYQVW